MTSMYLIPILADVQRDPRIYPNADPEVLARVESSVRDWILRDFETRSPRLVLIDVSVSKQYFRRKFEYLEFLRQDPRFSELWDRLEYRPAGFVRDYIGRRFAIYRRPDE